jgi:RHS repeat-associated protein
MMRSALFVILAWLSIATTVSRADDITYFHNDVSGTPQAATDAAGALVWREHYRPYGERLDNAPAAANNQLWFTGKPYDPDTGLTYMGARYYDSALGRFVGMDPAPFNEDNLHSSNRYAYANNNPYKYVDADGHSPVDVVFLAYDLGKLGVAIYSGEGIGSAAIDVAISVVGVASPIPLAGEMLKSARIVDKAVEGVRAAEQVAEGARAAEEGARVAEEAEKVAADGGEVLYRYRQGYETATRLGKQAAKAEEKIGEHAHGVSVTTKPKPGIPCGAACRADVEKHFPVVNTGGPGHRTVVLPKPVTREAADVFNALFRDVP